MRIKLTLVSLVFGLIIGKPSFATTSSDYSTMGKAVWSAFECSALAEKSNKPKEQERLFEYGYAKGLEFIEAIQSEKVEKKDLSKGTPSIMILLLQGPTPNFILGRIYERALDSALKDIYKTDEHRNSDETQEILAKNKFIKKNCQLTGK